MNAVIEHDQTSVTPLPQPVRAVTPMDMIDRALVSGAAPETLERLQLVKDTAVSGEMAYDQMLAAD